jgi:hypothetical protein
MNKKTEKLLDEYLTLLDNQINECKAIDIKYKKLIESHKKFNYGNTEMIKRFIQEMEPKSNADSSIKTQAVLIWYKSDIMKLIAELNQLMENI